MLPLEGIKVLDVGTLHPGAYCTMILGDLGAEVLRIEGPPEIKRLARTPAGPEGIREAAYNPFSRNKKNIVLNLKTEGGKHVLLQLIQVSDVLVEGFRPGVTKRLGIDYQTVSKLNPRIIYCSITGYGQDGPYRDAVGHDANFIAIAGALDLFRGNDSSPVLPLNLVGDYAGGSLHAAVAILAAIIARGRTKKGQNLDVAITDGIISLLSMVAKNYFQNGVVPKQKNFLASGVAYPALGVFETEEGGWITIACGEEWFWENLCRLLGREDYIPFQLAEGAKKEEVLAFMRTAFRQKTRDEWFDLLKSHNIPVGKVNTLDEAL